MSYSKIVLDVNNIYHRAHYVSGNNTHTLANGERIATGGIYNSLKMIRRVVSEFGEDYTTVYCLFDNSDSRQTKRKDIDPEYKANRDKKEHAFYKALNILHLILLSYDDRFITIQVPEHEADDIVKTVVDMKTKYEYMLLVSQDMDWAREISEKVHWAKYSDTYEIYDPERFKSEYGFEPSREKVVLYKALDGDSSDNIERPVYGLRKDVIERLVQDFDNVEDLMYSLKSLSYLSDKWKEKVKDALARIKLNYDLINYSDLTKEEVEDNIVEGSFKPKKLQSLYESLGFDIEKIDKRIVKDNKPENFFQFDRIDRP